MIIYYNCYIFKNLCYSKSLLLLSLLFLLVLSLLYTEVKEIHQNWFVLLKRGKMIKKKRIKNEAVIKSS